MENKRKKIVIGIIMTTLIVFSVVSNIYLLLAPQVGLIPKIGTVLNLLALTSAFVYCISGFRKKSQLFYKAFFLMYSIHILTGTYGMVVDFKGSVMAAAWVLAFVITFANVLMLFIPENMGEKRSKCIAMINVCIWFGFLIHHFIFKSHTIGIYTIRITSYLLSALLTVVLTFSKYEDKKERNTK